MDYEMSQSISDRLVAGISVILICFIGLFLNGLIFFKFACPKQLKNGFHVLCLSKSISNSIICIISLFWVGPAILLNNLFLPLLINKFLGQLTEYGVYLMGPLTQTLMGVERFFIIFFPLKISDYQRCRIAVFSIISCWIMSSGFTAVTYRDNCWVYYSIISFNYDSENDNCDNVNLDILKLICLVLAVFNVVVQILNLIKIKLMFSKQSRTASSQRRRRTLRLFIQSVIQDCLYGLDLLNSCNFFSVHSVLGQFFIYTFSLLFVHSADGLIICLFHFNASCRRRKIQNSNGNLVIVA
ncbi:G-protein coupled receptors family 1 profile domain-containing protein [Caenorhabditis elegans]|uniref:G-protein coupled receptors family 1 profile domain-containing protein n=1 Tax=Caenorhabditis elegans TaxID=6239 RepID=P90954_CAEEL|nr:G-protein coupled receptors family 1 profile domain-containing protein [Caenorhabditis elegans]CAB03257.2 G-protein coupled receptors family 1 profile domain-containing protein [Caenorhabditis elegans]|eukprot:NP_506392.2 Serpentine Receptor, class X [Caenorhabditis elegans]